MGFPFGADEDAAYVVAWLELNKLKGVNILQNNLNHLNAKD